jgi:hypothetical protein
VAASSTGGPSFGGQACSGTIKFYTCHHRADSFYRPTGLAVLGQHHFNQHSALVETA